MQLKTPLEILAPFKTIKNILKIRKITIDHHPLFLTLHQHTFIMWQIFREKSSLSLFIFKDVRKIIEDIFASLITTCYMDENENIKYNSMRYVKLSQIERNILCEFINLSIIEFNKPISEFHTNILPQGIINSMLYFYLHPELSMKYFVDYKDLYKEYCEMFPEG